MANNTAVAKRKGSFCLFSNVLGHLQFARTGEPDRPGEQTEHIVSVEQRTDADQTDPALMQ